MRVDPLYHDVPPAALTDVYTAGPNGATILKIIATNNTGGAAAVSVQRVPAGGSGLYLMNAQSVPANALFAVQGPIPLAPGDKIAVRNHTASAITVLVAGLLP